MTNPAPATLTVTGCEFAGESTDEKGNPCEAWGVTFTGAEEVAMRLFLMPPWSCHQWFEPGITRGRYTLATIEGFHDQARAAVREAGNERTKQWVDMAIASDQPLSVRHPERPWWEYRPRAKMWARNLGPGLSIMVDEPPAERLAEVLAHVDCAHPPPVEFLPADWVEGVALEVHDFHVWQGMGPDESDPTAWPKMRCIACHHAESFR